MKKYALYALSALSLSLLFACGGSEPAPTQQGQGGPDTQSQQQIMPMGKPVVEVPGIVKGKWKGVVLVVDDKEKKSKKDQPVSLGEKYKIPGSDLTIEVKEFFPSFVMQGSSITSMSNEPDNPAAQVVVMEGGSEIFSGWLFARYPTTHAFSHPKYAITLKEGIAKK